MTNEAQRQIPATIKREVRQRCGFGCVVCGMPLIEYDHMLDWATVQRHVAEDITLLCDRHHKERTNGLLPLVDVQAANANPYNLREGRSAAYALHYTSESCRVEVGGNTGTAQTGADFSFVTIDGMPLIGFRCEDNHYLLRLVLFDETNEPVVAIQDNELVYSSDLWDVEFIAQRLLIRSAPRRIFVEIEFLPPDGIRISRGRLLFNGVEIIVRPEHLLVVNNSNLLAGSFFQDCQVALNVGRPQPGGAAIQLTSVPRYGIDRNAALEFAKQHMPNIASLEAIP